MFPYYFVIVLFYSISILSYFLIRISLFAIYCIVVENLLVMQMMILVIVVRVRSVQVEGATGILLCFGATTAVFLTLLSIISGIFLIFRIFLLVIGVFGCISSIFGKIVFVIISILPIMNDTPPSNVLPHFPNHQY